MVNKLKKIFYWWAYLDLEHTCNKKETYFYRYQNEIDHKNLTTIRTIAIFFMIISVFVIISALTYFPQKDLIWLYSIALVFEGMFATLCIQLIKSKPPHLLCTLVTHSFMLHILAFGGYVGVVFSEFESATVYVALLIVSSILFIMPPIRITMILALANLFTLIFSYFYKDIYWFLSDLINCSGVFILSCLLAWRINRIRVEEAFSRAHILELNQQLKKMSITDYLTGLPNHLCFQNDYEEVFGDARKTGSAVGIMMMDLDHFKPYNDNYGHVQGDRCLSAVAAAFLQQKREGVAIYRFGGEEFIILLHGSACNEAASIAEQVRQSVEILQLSHDFRPKASIVTISLGLYVAVPADNSDPVSFIHNADQAMYQSKESGRNCVTIYQ